MASINKNRSGSQHLVSKALAQSVERSNLPMDSTNSSAATTATTSTVASTSTSNLKLVATAAATNTKQMLIALDTIQTKECLVLEEVHELKAEQLEIKQTLALIIEKLDLLRTSPPQPAPPRSRHFSDVILKKLTALFF